MRSPDPAASFDTVLCTMAFSGLGERLDVADCQPSRHPRAPEVGAGDLDQVAIEVDCVRLEATRVLSEQPTGSQRDLKLTPEPDELR
jgi:hypothetical protein